MSALPASKTSPAGDDRAAGGTVLLIVDMFSSWDFADAQWLLPAASAIAPTIGALAERCRAANVPVVYANDNQGRWRSDVRQVIAAARAGGGDGAAIARRLEPQATDYIVLKPKHSAFRATPLDLLLRHLHAHRLIVTGVTSDQCVLYTAADARMRDFDVCVPVDAVATQTDERNAVAMQHFAQVMKLPTPAAAALPLPGAQPGTASCARDARGRSTDAGTSHAASGFSK